jgi:glyoxylase I family protein
MTRREAVRTFERAGGSGRCPEQEANNANLPTHQPRRAHGARPDVSFGCADRDELEKWAARLDELGVEHGGIRDATYGSGVSFRDPDGIALEFFAPPA